MKEKFNITHSSPTKKKKKQDSPHRATGGIPGFGQEAEAGRSDSFSLEPFLGFLRER